MVVEEELRRNNRGVEMGKWHRKELLVYRNSKQRPDILYFYIVELPPRKVQVMHPCSVNKYYFQLYYILSITTNKDFKVTYIDYLQWKRMENQSIKLLLAHDRRKQLKVRTQ